MDGATVSRVKKTRSRKTCHRCHARKTRCNVQEHGTPCSKCAENNESCVIRRRKNQRVAISAPAAQIALPTPSSPTNRDQPPSTHTAQWSTSSTAYHVDSEIDPSGQTNESPSVSNIGSTNFDFTTLTDIDDIFNVTLDGFSPYIPPDVEDFAAGARTEASNNLCPTALAQASTLDPDDYEFLYRGGCFNLPPLPILRDVVRLYMLYVHPNLPILDERKIWSFFDNDAFTLGDFSYLVFRAIVFSVIHLLEPESLTQIGHATKRDARQAYYKQAKLLFDFGIERNPVAISQACLLLTYYAPTYNSLRVNSTWLVMAARYARIARANTFYLVEDPENSRILKRLWWCVLFRDRILSLGLKQTMNVELDTLLTDDQHILTVEDFKSDLDASQIHARETQLRLIEISIATCRLVQTLSPALDILYRYERINERVSRASTSLSIDLTGVHRCLNNLQSWFNEIIKSFPSPISLDDTSSSVCILANMMFCYHSTAVFALNAHRILLYETVPPSKSMVPFESSTKALEPAMDDIGLRAQELLQVRLAKYLPISASAFIALPLILQAINVTAARGMHIQESVERRRLEVFTKTLESQRLHFDGSDMIADILTNIVAYANDEKFLASLSTFRDVSQLRGHNKRALRWPELVGRHPRMFLRLLFRLDGTLCNGAITGEEDYPSELRRGATHNL